MTTKRIVITGASSGIGRATALAFSDSGHELVLIGRREELLHKVKSECRAHASIFTVDLTHLEAIPEIVRQVRSIPGDVEPVLVNCAGVGVFNEFAELPWKDVELQIRLNLLAPARLIQESLPWMLEVGRGQIVNVLSMAATQVLPFSGAYASSKAGLLMLGKVVSQEYRSRGVRVTNLLPGATDTAIWDGTPFGERREEMIPAAEVASVIRQIIESPSTFNYDEVVLMPPGGVL